MRIFFLFLFALSLHGERINLVSHFVDDPYVTFSSLKKAGIDVHVVSGQEFSQPYIDSNEVRKVVFFHPFPFPEGYKNCPKEKLVLFTWEPVMIPSWYYDLFSKVYTWDDSLVDNVKFFKFYYPYLRPMISDIVPFEKRKLAVMINSNFTFERIKMIEFFESKPFGEFDLFGAAKGKVVRYKNYRGPISGLHSGNEKTEVMKNYRFCICFENGHHFNGYVTEKIFGAFAAGCVPIYWGALNVENHIPKTCFIDYRDFSSKEELYQYIKNMPESVFDLYLANIRFFLESKKAEMFSAEHLDDILYEAVIR